MKSRLLSLMFVALVAGLAIVGPAAPAHAVLVTYSTVGTFTGGDAPGTSAYVDAANGIVITFNGVVSDEVNAPPTTGATYGQFDTSGTTAPTLTGVSSGFTLDIFQTTPEAGSTSFLGTLQGTLAIDSSQAFVLFTGLTQSIGDVIYRIIEADNGVLGRANISPPTTNNGLSSVEGEISIGVTPVIPEPSTMLMAALAAPALLLGLRKKGKVTV